jgi:hypothetical protein
MRNGMRKKEPPMSQRTCSCGFAAVDDSELAGHLGEMFIPADDAGADGVTHAEDGRRPPGQACLCGFTGPGAAALDEHLLAVFTPADRIGRDGRRHAAGPARRGVPTR